MLKRLGFGAAALRELLDLFAKGHHCVFPASPPDLRVVDADPDDDQFIACAVALGAVMVVSGDRHLLAMGDYMGTPIRTPRQFLDARES